MTESATGPATGPAAGAATGPASEPADVAHPQAASESSAAAPAQSKVVERFIRYARISTPSNPATSDHVPSTACQFDLSNLLCAELQALGLEDAQVDGHAYVTAHLPASPGCEDLPCLGLLAHVDASPDAPSDNINPRIVHYEGGELTIGVVDGQRISINARNTRGLEELAGQDLIVSDGRTLIAADDKAGVAEIMQLLAELIRKPQIRHPRLAICFCPDEEIGHGCALLDLEAFGADLAYTVDGNSIGGVEYETFNAAEAKLRIQGHEIHPGSAKGIMVNALNLLVQFDSMLPGAERPEHTSGHEGFYHLHDASGDCASATASYLIRDHDRARFEQRKTVMHKAAELLNARYGDGRVSVDISDTYYNMAEVISQHMELVDRAKKAFIDCGYTPQTHPVRGGTDGSSLSFRGLPCANLSTGGYNFHSVREFIPTAALDGMVRVLENLVQRFA